MAVFLCSKIKKRLNSRSIYVLDDDADVLQLIELVLVREGFKVSAFGDTFAFSQQVGLTSPDLFILDINLRDGNGLDISRALNENVLTAQVPVMLMSGNSFYRECYLDAGAKGFIAKPFNIIDFLTLVRSLIQSVDEILFP